MVQPYSQSGKDMSAVRWHVENIEDMLLVGYTVGGIKEEYDRFRISEDALGKACPSDEQIEDIAREWREKRMQFQQGIT